MESINLAQTISTFWFFYSHDILVLNLKLHLFNLRI